MTSFSDNFPHAKLLNALGDDITYKRGSKVFAIKAAVDRNVEHVGNDGYVIERRTEIELLKTDIAFLPQRGDVIKVKTSTFTVDSIISDDGYLVKVAVK